MGYNRKNRKAWSVNANEARRRKALSNAGDIRELLEDDEITIEITRKRTGEHKVFTLLPGSRCDNYRVYIDNEPFKNNKAKSGCWGISPLCQKIAKALPRFMSEQRLYS